MNSIKAVIVDDEPLLVDTLRSILGQFCEDVEVVATANDVFSAKTKIETHNPDVVFLDINMPKASGLDLMTVIKNRPFQVVFITAYAEYAIEALKLGAIHYILKPILSEDVIEAVNRVRNAKLNRPESKNPAREDSDSSSNKSNREKIIIQNNNTYLFLEDKDILWLEADSNYTKIYLVNGKVASSAKTMKYYEQIVSENLFYRIHKSYIVNTMYIKEYLRDSKGPYVIMAGDVKLRVAQLKQTGFRNFMKIRGK